MKPAHVITPFNEVSDAKIVKASEFQHRLKTLYKKKLSWPERIILACVEKPVSLLIQGKLFLDIATKKEVRDAFKSATDDGTIGFYKDAHTDDTYTHVAAFKLAGERDIKASLTPALTRKTWSLGEQAFNACHDYSAHRATRKLRPFHFG